MATQGVRTRTRPQAKGQPPQQAIDLNSLLVTPGKRHKAPKWQNDEKARLNNWTREQGVSSGKESKFKVVGVAPVRTREESTKSKVNTKWGMSTAEDKWIEDPSIVYIANARLDSFENAFPGRYSDPSSLLDANPDDFVSLYIAGPRAAVIETLVHQSILPAKATKVQYDSWIDSVAITLENHADNPDYTAFVDADKKEKTKRAALPTIEPGRIDELLWLASLLGNKRGAVRILDANGGDIGRYGEALTKPVSNVFTAWLAKKLAAGADISGITVDISGLTTGTDSRVQSYKVALTDEDISTGNYGVNQRRPLDFELEVHYKGNTYTIPPNSIWTSKADSISNLFNEIAAVNEVNGGESGITYTVRGNKDTVRRNTAALLEHVKKRGEGASETEKPLKQVKYHPGSLYGSKAASS